MASHQLPILDNNNTFEDAICDLFNKIHKNHTFKKFGRQGHNQKGIDLFSPDLDIAVQCKKKDLSRKYPLVKKELMDDIEKDVTKVISEGLKVNFHTLFFTSTLNDHPDIDEFCESLKEELNTKFEIIYWGWDTLASKFLDHQELLHKYWKNFMLTHDSEELKFHRNLNLKKRIAKDFGPWLNYKTEDRVRNSKMILRAFDGKQYPTENEPDEYGEYSWFAAEINSLYHNGMEFIFGLKEIELFKDNTWDFVKNRDEVTGVRITVAEVGQINFQDIVEYDMDGDPHYFSPHIYCRFIHKGLPFENTYYFDVNKSYNWFHLEDKRK